MKVHVTASRVGDADQLDCRIEGSGLDIPILVTALNDAVDALSPHTAEGAALATLRTAIAAVVGDAW